MKNRFYLKAAYVAGETLELTGTEFHHAANVARVRPGESIELFDGEGHAAAATVQSIAADRTVVLIDATDAPARESSFRIVLGMALIHLEKFELVLQKATELGVHRIIPILASRSEIRHERIRGRRERWERILFEAVKQSGRSRVPDLGEPQSLAEVLNGGGPFILFEGEQPSAGDLEPGEGATLLIGPEGGWTEEELGLARAHGAIFRRLGPRRLRAETAAIAAMTAVGLEAGDLRG